MSEDREYAKRWRRQLERKPDGMPAPWRRHIIPIGGCVGVALDPTGAWLVAMSHEGRGLFDCSSGERVARDYDPRWFRVRAL